MAFERTNHNEQDPGDDLLLERVRGKDQQAMAVVFDRYGGMVYSVALRVLKDPEQAEDVMQEILFQLWKKPDAFVQGRGSLGGWLMVLARNRAIDLIRRRKPTDSPRTSTVRGELHWRKGPQWHNWGAMRFLAQISCLALPHPGLCARSLNLADPGR